jgi:hypothetical protein
MQIALLCTAASITDLAMLIVVSLSFQPEVVDHRKYFAHVLGLLAAMTALWHVAGRVSSGPETGEHPHRPTAELSPTAQDLRLWLLKGAALHLR